jgi:hypothetical protein
VNGPLRAVVVVDKGSAQRFTSYFMNDVIRVKAILTLLSRVHHTHHTTSIAKSH